MIPRTPVGDLVAALVLFGAVALLVYVSTHDGRLGLIDRYEQPILFWLSLATISLLTLVVAAMLAWEASAAFTAT